jgi:hypothetical protein
MDSSVPVETNTLVILVKVLVGLAPSFILQEVFESHQKLAYCVGLVIGAVAVCCIPPRVNARKSLALVCCAIILGIIRSMLH